MIAKTINEGLEQLAPKSEDDIYDIVGKLQDQVIAKHSLMSTSIYQILNAKTDWIGQDSDGDWYVLAKHIAGTEASGGEDGFMWIKAQHLLSDTASSGNWSKLDVPAFIERLEKKKESIEKDLNILKNI